MSGILYWGWAIVGKLDGIVIADNDGQALLFDSRAKARVAAQHDEKVIKVNYSVEVA